MTTIAPDFANDGEFIDGIYEVAVETKTGILLDAIFDPENESPTQGDFDPIFALGQQFFLKFDAEFERLLTAEVAAEIVEESYEDTNDEPREEEYTALERDLALKAAQFFPETMMLIYESPRLYPKEEIVVTLSAEFEIDEVYFD